MLFIKFVSIVAFILNIETSTTSCSVSIAENGKLIHFIEHDEGYSHAENLHPFIKTLLEHSKINIQQLNAVAVSKGPGSYTGLRIGVSAAKGIAYALNIPLISVDTLQTMTLTAISKMPHAQFFCPMLDARRMEVYTNVYNAAAIEQRKTEALIITNNSIEVFKSYKNICFFGNGYNKAKDILTQLPDVSFLDHVQPSAKEMATLSYQKFMNEDFENVMYFEPFYLKDFLILKKKSV